MKFRSLSILIFALVFSLPLAAKDKVEPAVNANTKDSFDTVSTWVRKEMGAGGRYAHVSAAERGTVEAKLTEMGGLYAITPDTAHMTAAQKLQMFNDQEQVNAILAQRDNERLICKHEMPMGSHIPVTTCDTAGNIEARRRSDGALMDSMSRKAQQTPPPSGH